MLLRQPMLIFNFPGEKSTRSSLLSSQQDFQKIKIPSQQSCLTVFCQPERLKKTKKITQMEFASQR